MKSVSQPSKSSSSNSGVKSKKTSKDREKRKSHNSSSENSSDKGSPSKENKQYAGISSDSIFTYAEQHAYEHLSEEVYDTLTEDINYKLRYIIHDTLLKARLCGRGNVNANDIEETFRNLNIEKVYGATATPNWVPFGDQNLLYLDDTKINLMELAEEETTYAQYSSIVLTKQWFPDPELNEPCPALKNYFITACQSVISSDEELRKAALKDISENPRVGPIIQWFYHFGYFLLMKNITYDCLTLSALYLIETLENSPLSNLNVSVKQLNLLVRLLLQRLLISNTTTETLKPMCSILAVLCLRQPLKEMVITKINQKFMDLNHNQILPVLTMIYYLGFEAVLKIYLPNIQYFLEFVTEKVPSEIVSITLAIYGLICLGDYNDSHVHGLFHNKFGDILVNYWKPGNFTILNQRTEEEINFVPMKSKLIKTRRKVDCIIKKASGINLEDVFILPTKDCSIRRKISKHIEGFGYLRKETHITVGKRSLLLSVLKQNRIKSFFKCDHSLASYNF